MLVGNSRRRVRRARLARGARRRRPASVVWTAYSTGPDSDVLIGPGFKPFYAQRPRQGPRRPSWPPRRLEDRRRHRLGLDLLRSRARPALLRHRATRPLEPRAAPRRQQVDGRHLRARPDTGEAVWFYQWSPHDLYDYDGVNENDPARHADRRRAAQGARARRSQRLRLRASTARRARCCRPSRSRTSTTIERRRSEDRAADLRRRARSPTLGQVVRDICPRRAGRQGLAAVGVLAAHRAALHPAPEHLHGLGSHAGELHRRHARSSAPNVEDVRRARRPSRRVLRLGPGRAGARRGRSRRIPGVERRAGDRRRRGLLRHDGRLVQGGRRAQRRSCCGSSRPAPGSSASRSATAAPTASQYVAMLSGVGGWAGAIVSGDLDPRDRPRPRLRRTR